MFIYDLVSYFKKNEATSPKLLSTAKMTIG